MNMTSAYEFDISRSTRAADLHALIADETLASDEKDELLKIIAAKFGTLNQRALGPQKPRWD